MKKILIPFLALFMLLFSIEEVLAQRRKKTTEETSDKVSLDAFKFRNIGPAFLSGRISDIAMHPETIASGMWLLLLVVYGKQKMPVQPGSLFLKDKVPLLLAVLP